MKVDKQLIEHEFKKLLSVASIIGIRDMLSAMEKFYVIRAFEDIDMRFQVMAEFLRTEVEDPKKQSEMIKDFEEFEEARKEVIIMELKIFEISKFIDSETEGIERYKESYELNEEIINLLSHIQSRVQSIKKKLEDWMDEVREQHSGDD